MTNEQDLNHSSSVIKRIGTDDLYLPEKVLIKLQSKADPATTEIIRRVRSFDSSIPIVQMMEPEHPYPIGSSALWRWEQRKNNLILTHRTTPLLTTFASPGNIIERLGVIPSPSWQYPSDLQTVFGANTTEALEGLGFDGTALMQKSVYQYGVEAEPHDSIIMSEDRGTH